MIGNVHKASESSVLIVSNTGDPHCDYLVDACNRQQVPFFRLNTDRFYLGGKISLDVLADRGFLEIDGHYCDLSTVGLLVFRRPNAVHAKRNDIDSWVGFLLDSEWRSIEYALSDIVPGVVMNPMQGSVRAQNKIVQMSAARKVGLSVPETIISTDIEYLRDFAGRFDVVTKGICNAHIQVNNILRTGNTKRTTLNDLKNYDPTGVPTLLQQEISPCAIWRVVVTLDQVTGVRLSGDMIDKAVDSRLVDEELNGVEAVLPKDFQNKMIALCKELNIVFCASDVIEDKDGRLWFIDLNPEGQWAYLEKDYNTIISDKIISMRKSLV